MCCFCNTFGSSEGFYVNNLILWCKLSGSHLAFDMNCQEPILPLIWIVGNPSWLFSGRQQFPGFFLFLFPLPSTRWSSIWSKAAIHALESRFCCFRLWPNDAHFGQRQLSRLGIKILLLPTLTRWNLPRPKAANTSHNQDFAAFAVDPMKPTKTKGSKHFL